MSSILVERDRRTLLVRFRKLTPEHQPSWGALNAKKMVCHLGDQLAVALGDIPSEPKGSLLTNTVAKWFVLYVPFPAPKGKVNTVPEMLTTQPSNWGQDSSRFESLLSRLVDAKALAPHPAFGKLSRSQWGILAAKHIDHHLRQFGV
jgi:hypothetical protein